MTKIRLIAFSDAAGKFNPEAPLNGNEDNFYIDDNLADDVTNSARMDTPLDLSECGCLMVVADGMGGMNAGEVASALAIDTVKEFFKPSKITPAIAASHSARRQYMESVVREADRRIKTQAASNPDQTGMGSTIIMAWIVGHQMSLTWIGDSRAYRFNPAGGLQLVSRDHSYVQELVDNGMISYEDTFEHPQGNIVTRSLGDPSKDAMPESKLVDLFKDDIVMLCSDGLSGVVRDVPTSDENGNIIVCETIEEIMQANTSSMTACREQLMAAAERNHWYDNVTVLLCQILDSSAAYSPAVASRATSIVYNRLGRISGTAPAVPKHTSASSAPANPPVGNPRHSSSEPRPAAPAGRNSSASTADFSSAPKKKSNTVIYLLVALIIALLMACAYMFFFKSSDKSDSNEPGDVVESTRVIERTLPSSADSEAKGSKSRGGDSRNAAEKKTSSGNKEDKKSNKVTPQTPQTRQPAGAATGTPDKPTADSPGGKRSDKDLDNEGGRKPRSGSVESAPERKPEKKPETPTAPGREGMAV